MHRKFFAGTALAAALIMSTAAPAAAQSGRYEVFGVAEDDLLKLRAGPGTGFVVVAGFPNGTALRVYECTQTGGTRWCEVAMERARGLRGYVSFAYLRKR
ncbi:SH3 domain-containing protein [Citreimonas salinaria]|uniref:SH3 domain-containing protein n=1 Tax=Citreimonas salinaria TaxID=321339 RepID=A0A1H3GW62_9RHOB|nr:SH3 domain-containing protein [Citreimonas salinaria]SDY06888.1 SH3 domain-containing protein [Citreimonas salinaria]